MWHPPKWPLVTSKWPMPPAKMAVRSIQRLLQRVQQILRRKPARSATHADWLEYTTAKANPGNTETKGSPMSKTSQREARERKEQSEQERLLLFSTILRKFLNSCSQL